MLALPFMLEVALSWGECGVKYNLGKGGLPRGRYYSNRDRQLVLPSFFQA